MAGCFTANSPCRNWVVVIYLNIVLQTIEWRVVLDSGGSVSCPDTRFPGDGTVISAGGRNDK